MVKTTKEKLSILPAYLFLYIYILPTNASKGTDRKKSRFFFSTSRNERDIGNKYKYNQNAYKHIHWEIKRNVGKLSIDHFSYIFTSPNLAELAESIFEARPFIHLLLMHTALVEGFLLYEVCFFFHMRWNIQWIWRKKNSGFPAERYYIYLEKYRSPFF